MHFFLCVYMDLCVSLNVNYSLIVYVYVHIVCSWRDYVLLRHLCSLECPRHISPKGDNKGSSYLI